VIWRVQNGAVLGIAVLDLHCFGDLLFGPQEREDVRQLRKDARSGQSDGAASSSIDGCIASGWDPTVCGRISGRICGRIGGRSALVVWEGDEFLCEAKG
jgi:hypothetical protein